MPIYSYECPRGHKEDRIRPIAQRNEPYPCDECVAFCRLHPDALQFASNPRMMRRPRIEMPKEGRLKTGGHPHYHHRIGPVS